VPPTSTPTGGGNPLFLFDRETGRNRNIGFNEAGQQHPSELIDADVSDDGTIVAYATYPGGEPPPEGVAARPMDERGTNYEVWVHDTESGITTRMATFDLSLTSVTHGPRATPDGAFVWVAGGISGGTLVFERATGATTEVYRDIEIDYLVPFPDGQRIAFTSGNSLVPDDVNGADDAYVYDRSSGEFALLLEHDPDRGLPLPSSISNDGRYVAMAGRGSPLVLDANENSIVAELSPSLGLQALAISGNGQWIAYATSAEVVDGDTNGTKTSSWHACLSTSPREATRPARTNGRWAGRRRLDHAGQLGLQRLQSRRPQCQSPVFR
jgi:Tol biopolymer transport system component